MIENITIENFRQFDHLEVKNLKRINFFVGKNNCGKTTVLEAIILLSEYYNNELLERRMYRGLPKLPYDTLYYFHNIDPEIPVKLKLQTGTHDFSFDLSKFDSSETKIGKKSYELFELQKIYPRMYRELESENHQEIVKYQFMKRKIGAKKGKESQEIMFITKPSKNESIRLLTTPFLISDKNDNNNVILQQIDRILNEIKKETLITYLQFFDERIEDIATSNYEGIRLQIKGMSKQIPLAIMGDGIQKYLKIIAPLVLSEYPYILIDEIENGLHYTTSKDLLRSILELSKKQNIQMFITTHDNEILKSVSEIMQENEFSNQKDDVVVLQIDHSPEGYDVYPYNADIIEHRIENGLEMRN